MPRGKLDSLEASHEENKCRVVENAAWDLQQSGPRFQLMTTRVGDEVEGLVLGWRPCKVLAASRYSGLRHVCTSGAIVGSGTQTSLCSMIQNMR